MSEAEYVLANVSPQTRDRFSGLEAVCDQVTFRHLESAGISEGWSCLEVGAGGGSVARWMGERVGRAGHVLVTDLDTRWVDATGPNLDVRQLDLRRDPLPERDVVLGRLVAALKPGGWFVVSEFDNRYDSCPNPADERDALVNRVQETFIRLITAAGSDVRYGRRLDRVFRAAGLLDVRADGYLAVAVGGSPGSRLMLANIRQVRPRLVEAFGLTNLDLTRYEAALEDLAFSWLMPVLFTACGRRPRTTTSRARARRLSGPVRARRVGEGEQRETPVATPALAQVKQS
jgi:hypothetical protein